LIHARGEAAHKLITAPILLLEVGQQFHLQSFMAQKSAWPQLASKGMKAGSRPVKTRHSQSSLAEMDGTVALSASSAP